MNFFLITRSPDSAAATVRRIRWRRRDADLLVKMGLFAASGRDPGILAPSPSLIQ